MVAPGEISNPPRVIVTRDFCVSAERAFDAWIDRHTIGQWLFATPTGKMTRVEGDPCVGGVFTLIERRGEMSAEHYGTYLELDRPRRVVFSFFTNVEASATIVTIDIATTATGCRLTLSHPLDPKWAAFEDRARQGWTMILNQLGASIETP